MTFNSVYQILTPLTTVKKQWFVEWFDGDDLKAYWTKRDVAGTGTFAMADAVDEGFSIITGASASGQSRIDFNDIRHYNFDAAIIIAVCRRLTATNAQIGVGLHNRTSVDFAFCEDSTNGTNKRLETFAAGTGSNTESSIPIDTVFTGYKMEMGSVNVKMTINGVLEVTKTTNRPTLRQQPTFDAFNPSTTASEGRIRYYEAFNT